jgi:hypothetical protein
MKPDNINLMVENPSNRKNVGECIDNKTNSCTERLNSNQGKFTRGHCAWLESEKLRFMMHAHGMSRNGGEFKAGGEYIL